VKNILDYFCSEIRSPERVWYTRRGERGLFKLIKIYVARHGETTWNEEGRIQGRSDPGLSDKGYAQSFALRHHLKDRPLSAIYTSTRQRSILTAEPLANHLRLPIQSQPELDEIAFGILEGKFLHHFDEELKLEWERFKDNRFLYRIPGAENYADVANRVRPFAERLLGVHQGHEILVVGHRVVNRLLIGMLMEYPVEKVLKIEQTNDMLYLIEKNSEAKIFHYMDGQIREGLVLVGEEVIL
jgi:broad specificity phosphatase PhoE